jgi:hypothetical protein
MRTPLIAIDGCGGAGKSTSAQRVAGALGRVQIVPTDDFARPENSIDWWPEVVVCPRATARQRARPLPAIWLATRSAGEWVEVWPADYVLLEGVSASREAFRPHVSLTVWVETARDMRLRRGLARRTGRSGPVACLDGARGRLRHARAATATREPHRGRNWTRTTGAVEGSENRSRPQTASGFSTRCRASVPAKVMCIGWLRDVRRHRDGVSAFGRRGAAAVPRV